MVIEQAQHHRRLTRWSLAHHAALTCQTSRTFPPPRTEKSCRSSELLHACTLAIRGGSSADETLYLRSRLTTGSDLVGRRCPRKPLLGCVTSHNLDSPVFLDSISNGFLGAHRPSTCNSYSFVVTPRATRQGRSAMPQSTMDRMKLMVGMEPSTPQEPELMDELGLNDCCELSRMQRLYGNPHDCTCTLLWRIGCGRVWRD